MLMVHIRKHVLDPLPTTEHDVQSFGDELKQWGEKNSQTQTLLNALPPPISVGIRGTHSDGQQEKFPYSDMTW